MNRIYQGRVTNVEIPDGNDGTWKPFDPDPKIARDKWQEFLWHLHEMFQNDVNYLLAAFAAQVPDECEDEIWRDYRAAIERSWELYTGRQGTWERPFKNACVLVGCKEDASFNEFRRKLNSLTGSRASPKQKFEALKQLFESATDTAMKLTDPDEPVEESLKGKAKDLFGSTLVTLCAQKTKVTPRDIVTEQRNSARECTKKVNDGGRLEWADVFYFKTDKSSRLWTRDEASKNIVQCLEKLIAELNETLNDAKKPDQKTKLSDLAGRLEKQTPSLSAWCNNPKTDLPTSEPTRKGSGGYDLKAAILFAVRPDADGFRDAFLLFNQSRLKGEPTANGKADAAYVARMAGGLACPLFPFFCDLWAGRFNDESIGQGIWPDFEKQAFSEVFTKLGQFIVRGRKFELRLAIANQTIARIEEQKKSDVGLQAVERIAEGLADELPDTAVDEYGRRRPYGIRERTLKGWKKVRPAWRETLKKTPTVSAEDLIKQKNRMQERQREKYGSAALFDRLAKEPEIWNHTDREDAVETWASYVENLEEKEHLEAERLFAPAHATRSPRFFRWSETNNKEHLAASTPEVPFAFEADALDLTAKKKTKVKIHFWSPRLLRDGLRGKNEKLDKEEPDQAWMPPVLRAFVQAHGWPCDKQTFAGASVRLAPRRKENIQLVFEPELNTNILSTKWKENFPFSAAKNKEAEAVGLYWPRKAEDKVPWFDRGDVRGLGVDLGLTNSAAWQILLATNKKAGSDTNRLRHRLNPDSDRLPWFAHSIANGIIRIAGEDRWCWRKFAPTEKDKIREELKKAANKRSALCRRFSSLNRDLEIENATHAFLPELSGSAGRNATKPETDEAENYFSAFKNKGFNIADRQPNWKTKLSFPEQNDELLWGLKRVRTQLFRLNRWSEQLGGQTNSKPYQSAIEIIGKLRGDDPLGELVALTGEPKKLKSRIAELAAEYLDCFKNYLPQIADRILPWRRGRWIWKPCENDWHSMKVDETKPRPKALLAGQRGVSLARLNQLKDLRQLAQSLNHLCRRKQIAPREVVPEPFEDCRQAMEDVREDRAKQIAHEIFAVALGVELAPPPEDKQERKKSESLHGVYCCLDRGPVNFIALENLTEYKTAAKQGRRENRQLTSWSHRRIHKILGELCELVGLPIVLVDPKFTSRFSAKDHSAGFRAEEVWKDDPRRSFWQRKAKEEPRGWQAEFLSWLDKLPERKTLLLPKKGGEVFVSLGNDNSTYHADLNAAYRIALRALAHRDRADISTLAKVKDKYYIADMAGVLPGSFLQEGMPFKIVFNSERLWDTVNNKLAWERCSQINKTRMKKFGISVEQLPSCLYPDEEDDVPMKF